MGVPPAVVVLAPDLEAGRPGAEWAIDRVTLPPRLGRRRPRPRHGQVEPRRTGHREDRLRRTYAPRSVDPVSAPLRRGLRHLPRDRRPWLAKRVVPSRLGAATPQRRRFGAEDRRGSSGAGRLATTIQRSCAPTTRSWTGARAVLADGPARPALALHRDRARQRRRPRRARAALPPDRLASPAHRAIVRPACRVPAPAAQGGDRLIRGETA